MHENLNEIRLESEVWKKQIKQFANLELRFRNIQLIFRYVFQIKSRERKWEIFFVRALK